MTDNKERICPDCGVERADYEGPNGAYLPTCPNCGSRCAPATSAVEDATFEAWQVRHDAAYPGDRCHPKCDPAGHDARCHYAYEHSEECLSEAWNASRQDAQKRIETLEATLATLEESDRAKSPCGHFTAYAWTEDGGKTIICTLCALAIREKHIEELEGQLADAIRERDLAIAHDRQPYPTAWAYEKVCAVLESVRAEQASEDR